jgi:serine/threonine protein kinase
MNFGKYEVKRELGKGAMGVVYLAYDPVLERQVAIKTIGAMDSDQDLKERFIREARSAGKLRHNNIITIYDFGEQEGQLFIAMEYLEGKDLDGIIASKPKMDLREKLEIIRQICLGLDYAHKNNIFHRDIKPANIKILQDNTIKIMDFGLATMQTSGLTKTGTIMGTPHYMSPEMVQGKRADARSDQFAVGVIMYELLTYSKPFQGESISTILYQILNTEPRAMDPALISQYPELQRIARRAMQKDPEKRYQNMKAMADDIEALQHKLIKKGFHKEDATLLIGDKDTTVLMDTELDFPRAAKKKKSKTLAYAGIGLIVAIAVAAVLYFIVFSQPAAPAGAGYLSFNIKPWAVVEKIENTQSGEIKNFKPSEEASLTPLRISLPPGKYKITYKNSSIGTGPLTKEFIITSQQVTEIRGSITDSFINDAIKHFKISK